jgi:hypothetical protein
MKVLFLSLCRIVSHKEIVNVKCLHAMFPYYAAMQARSRWPLIDNRWQVPVVCVYKNK